MELNQIYNMDCNEYMKTLPDACVSLIIADLPYGIARQMPLSGYSHGVVRGIGEEWDIFSSNEGYEEFADTEFIKNLGYAGGKEY